MDKQDNINLIEEAKSETTSGDRLKELAALNDELASHKSKAVRKAVISNRNTLTEALFKFGEHFDRELLDSTTFISHFKKNNFIKNIPTTSPRRQSYRSSHG